MVSLNSKATVLVVVNAFSGLIATPYFHQTMQAEIMYPKLCGFDKCILLLGAVIGNLSRIAEFSPG